MDQLGLKRYCCRRMIMTHVDLIEKLLKYVATPEELPVRLARPPVAILGWKTDRLLQVHPRRPQRQEEQPLPELVDAASNG